jgi:hypothetical protein
MAAGLGHGDCSPVGIVHLQKVFWAYRPWQGAAGELSLSRIFEKRFPWGVLSLGEDERKADCDGELGLYPSESDILEASGIQARWR